MDDLRTGVDSLDHYHVFQQSEEHKDDANAHPHVQSWYVAHTGCILSEIILIRTMIRSQDQDQDEDENKDKDKDEGVDEYKDNDKDEN